MSKFVYTTPQFAKIRKTLEVDEDEHGEFISKALDRVQFTVRLALEVIREYRSLSVDSDIYSRFLKLGPSIDKNLNVLEHKDSQNTLLEYLPGLDQQLKTLRQMVEGDQRRQGGQSSVEHQHKRWLITELANVFRYVTGIKPTAKAKEPF